MIWRHFEAATFTCRLKIQPPAAPLHSSVRPTHLGLCVRARLEQRAAISCSREASGSSKPARAMKVRKALRRRAGVNARNDADREPGAVGSRQPGPAGRVRSSKRLRLGEIARRARQRAIDTGPMFANRRQQPVPQEVAREAHVAIGRVLDPLQLRGARAQASISRRETSSKGRAICPGPNDAKRGMAASPATPAPRNNCSSSVSTWSSRCCAVTSTSPGFMTCASSA